MKIFPLNLHRYDGALWQIALALFGELATAEKYPTDSNIYTYVGGIDYNKI